MHASKDVRSRQGKMEKSIVSFHANHPEWAASPEASRLIGGLKRFQVDSTAAGMPAFSDGPMNARGLGLGGAAMARLGASMMSLSAHPGASMSVQSLAMPLGTSRYMRQENYFYWLDRVRALMLWFGCVDMFS